MLQSGHLSVCLSVCSILLGRNNAFWAGNPMLEVEPTDQRGPMTTGWL